MKYFLCIATLTFWLVICGTCGAASRYVDLTNVKDIEIETVARIVRTDYESGSELSLAQEDQILRQYPICIPLGPACAPAFQLKMHKIRYAAYPFDWGTFNCKTIIKIIENDFDQLLDEKFIVFNSHDSVCNTLYPGFRLSHVCPVGATKENFFREYWPILKDRMQRRVNRFFKALSAGKHVYFVFGSVMLYSQELVTKEGIAQFVELIKNKFPKLDFSVIALNGSEDFKTDWRMPQVINLYHPDKSSWAGNSSTWSYAFKLAGILPK